MKTKKSRNKKSSSKINKKKSIKNSKKKSNKSTKAKQKTKKINISNFIKDLNLSEDKTIFN